MKFISYHLHMRGLTQRSYTCKHEHSHNSLRSHCPDKRHNRHTPIHTQCERATTFNTDEEEEGEKGRRGRGRERRRGRRRGGGGEEEDEEGRKRRMRRRGGGRRRRG